MQEKVRLVVFFTDGSNLEFEFSRDSEIDSSRAVANVRKALEKDKVSIEVDGDLFVIPMNNVRYVQVAPAPPDLPSDAVIRHARLIG